MGKNIRWLFLVVIIFVLLGFVRVDHAAAKVIKISHASPFPKTFSFSRSEVWFMNEINKRGKGKIDWKIYWSGSLGKTAALPGLIRSGGVDVATITPGYYPGEFPLGVAPNNLFFVNKNRKEAIAVVNDLYFKGPMNDELKRHNMKPLFVHILNPYNAWTREPITTLEGFKGLKIRTWGPYLPRFCETVGAIGVQMVTAEWFEGMQRGAVGAGLFANDMAMGMKVYDVSKDVTDLKLGVTGGPVIGMNIKKWNSLPQDVKQIILDVMKEMPAKELEVAYAIEKEAVDKMKEIGVKIHPFPKEILEDWIARTPVFSQMWFEELKKRGLEKDGKECWKRWQEILTELRK